MFVLFIKKCHVSTKYNTARGPHFFLVLPPPHPPNTLRCRFCFDPTATPLSGWVLGSPEKSPGQWGSAGFHLVGITSCRVFRRRWLGGGASRNEKPGKSPQDKQPSNMFHSSNEEKKYHALLASNCSTCLAWTFCFCMLFRLPAQILRQFRGYFCLHCAQF